MCQEQPGLSCHTADNPVFAQAGALAATASPSSSQQGSSLLPWGHATLRLVWIPLAPARTRGGPWHSVLGALSAWIWLDPSGVGDIASAQSCPPSWHGVSQPSGRCCARTLSPVLRRRLGQDIPVLVLSLPHWKPLPPPCCPSTALVSGRPRLAPAAGAGVPLTPCPAPRCPRSRPGLALAGLGTPVCCGCQAVLRFRAGEQSLFYREAEPKSTGDAKEPGALHARRRACAGTRAGTGQG